MCEYIIRAHLGLSKNFQLTILNISGAACEPDLNPEKWLHETGAIVVTSAEVRSPAFKVRGSMFKVQASPPSSAFATANTPHCHSPLAPRHSPLGDFRLSSNRFGIPFASVVPRIRVSKPCRQSPQHWSADRSA